MTHFDQGHHGHFERAFPKLTAGIKLLLAINVAMFLVKNVIFDLILAVPISHHVGLSVANVLDGYGLGVLRTVSYQFFHSINPFHLLWNMIFLYFFGTMVEGERDGGWDASHLRQGKTGIVTLYLMAGIAGGLGHLAISAMMGKTAIPVIGASGSVYGIMVFAACMFPRRRLNFIFVQPELRYFAGVLVFIGVFMSLADLRGITGGRGVSDAAHVGGALWGYLAYKLAHKGVSLPDPLAWWKRKRMESAAKQHANQQAVLDQILEKVHAQGMGALTPAERRFLEKVSKNRN